MGNPSVTYTFVNSQTSDGTQVNQNFTDLINAFSDGTKDLTMNNVTVNTAFIAKGTTQLGDATSDTIDTQARFINHLIPSADNTYDIGIVTTNRWRNIYVGTAIYVGSIINTGTLTLPTSTDTLVGKATTDVFTNKSISGSTNTFSNIPNTATTATSSNTNSTIVARDGSGAISVGSISVNGISIGSATNAITNLNSIGSSGAAVSITTHLLSQAGSSTGSALVVDGVIFSTASTVGNTGAGETTLHSTTLLGNSLKNTGDFIEAEFGGGFANTANNKAVKFYYGANSATMYSATTANQNWFGKVKVLRTGASTQRIIGFVMTSNNLTNVVDSTLATTDTSDQTVKTTGTATADNDLNSKFLTLRYGSAS